MVAYFFLGLFYKNRSYREHKDFYIKHNEYDPTASKSIKHFELAAKALGEEYQKSENEDVVSIVTGLMGKKGRVQVTFGQQIDDAAFASAASLAKEIDRQIVAGYACFPINFAAHKLLSDQGHIQPLSDYGDIRSGLESMKQRAGNETDAVKYQLYSMYAQPVIRKQLSKHE